MMKIVLLYKDTPNPLGLPGEWPAYAIEDDGRRVDGTWFRCTDQDLADRLSKNRDDYEKWAASVPQIVKEPEPTPVGDPAAPDITLEQLTQWVADKFGVDVDTVKSESAVRSANYVSKAP